VDALGLAGFVKSSLVCHGELREDILTPFRNSRLMALPRRRPSSANAGGFRRMRLAAAVQAQTATSSSLPGADGLEISDVSAHRLREPDSHRQYTVIRLRTRNGTVGYGETSFVSADDLAQARQRLLGQRATACEPVRQRLASVPHLEAAINVALLDILGKHTRTPVYQILGGPTRGKVRVMTPLPGDSDEALLDSMRRAKEAGFLAGLVPVLPPAASNQGQAYVRSVRKRLEKLREAGGENFDFVLDGTGSLSPGDASSLAAALERFHLLWFDEPCRVLNLSTLRRISSESVTPIGLGRRVHRAADFQDLLREEVIDVLRPSLALNGLVQIRKMAALAEAYYVAVAPHHDGGPIGAAAGLHLAASLPNFFIQQVPWAGTEADRTMRAELLDGGQMKIADGFAALPTGSGLGVTVNERALEKFKE
jgi:galactonate dehydratase